MTFDAGRYVEAATLVKPFLEDLRPTPFDPLKDRLPDAASAVYIATDRHGNVLYVGSVRRGTSRALRARIAEHLRQRPEATEWCRIWVMRVQDGLSRSTVHWVEARVGRHLRPSGNRRLPRFPSQRFGYPPS